MDIIETKSVSREFAKTNGVLLKETATMALVFFPEIHPGGVRGHLVRFKKTRNEPWEKIPEQDFKKLKLYEGVHIELGTQQIDTLCEEIYKRKLIVSQGVSLGIKKYVVADEGNILLIDDNNIKNIFDQILIKGYTRNFFELLQEANPSLVDQLTAGHVQLQRKKIIDDLKIRLTQSYHETKGDDSWQKWIYKHSWIFGSNYQIPIEKQKLNIIGCMPDYLFPTVDNFVDILEIKLPTFEVIEEDRSHKGSWIWSKEANCAIGQVVNYLSEIDRLRLEIERLIKISFDRDILMLKPRAYILIGQSKHWTNEKKEGLKKLNYALHGIEIITYSDLIKRGETFINFSEDINVFN